MAHLPSAALSFPSPQVRSIGRYRLFGEIASGGMATVHFGRLKGAGGFSRTVAIKRLHPNFAKDSEFVAMFLDEARLVARIRHPNVVPTLDVVSTEGEIFLVMEYVHGESFAKLLRAMRVAERPAAPRIIATIMSGVLHGLHAAHEAKTEHGESLNIVHRDVSPQNVLVGNDGVARVLDFGVAKALGRLEATRDGKIKGKLAYMPPEQLQGGHVTRQTDIYAASVVTWQALTGRRLFRGEHEAALVKAILDQPLIPPSSVAPNVPAAFDDVVMRGLDRNPARRYATARDMALQLERCVGIASPSEVGDWVASLAHDELSKRAARLAEMESASWPADARRPQEWTPALLEDDPNPRPAPSGAPDVSHVIAAPGIPPLTRPRRRLAVLTTLAGSGFLALLLLAVAASHSSTRNAPVAAGLSTPPVASTASHAALEPLAPSAAVTAIDVQSSEPTTQSNATAASSARRDIRDLRDAKPVSQGVPSVKPARRDCDVPFTIDGNGHKHYKAACL